MRNPFKKQVVDEGPSLFARVAGVRPEVKRVTPDSLRTSTLALKRPSRPIPTTVDRSKKIHVHWMFDKVSNVPVRPKIRKPFRPDLIDATKFHVDPIRPYPEWPLICLLFDLAAYPTEKEMMDSAEKCGHLPTVIKWQCKFCRHWHRLSTSHSDSNGRPKAGSGKISKSLKRLIEDNKI